MPELPFIQVLVENLVREVVGRTIIAVRVPSPAIVKTFDPPITTLSGRRIDQITRQGKLIVFHLSEGLLLVLHLMRDGRLQIASTGPPTRPRGRAAIPKPLALGLMLDDGRELRVNETGPKKRAGAYVLPVEQSARSEPLAGLGPDPLSETFTPAMLMEGLRAQPALLKRAITQQRYVVGIGNAFADEILWEARLSPFASAATLSSGEIERLHTAIRSVFTEALQQHRAHFGSNLPTREPVALLRIHRHGGEPCPRCGTRIETVHYAEKETYYCPHCQTKGKVYADRRMSPLLK
jgi:formamidopyrimidine-DNA glycosylase